ncbi:restriction endonuclease subunit S [Vibrio parahaemolyticus]|uniref:restriction endonuclease subunit S n=2 Tax=Vibrio harveyi group TaxID=717610 RepID=UPI0004006387|nr:restriction endonuclease subunit S [Vibrio parahaemolyticus]EGR1555950.1 restriction endonuclease subunit S [Vibrio parahaemolyticus]EHR6441714.1 restriction endonuclease subunit S [Vibrio parahaemolyticus]EJG1582570.1 restriction endonuclease subunit S [Vibrio parahaemolyticus]MBM4941507.1 restriction endonuclease subunit S [Vibrio parahaemolyticus]MCA6691260.1 restriction endonuclease subunit S [Vibrio parahaemolyticus]
MAKLQPLNDKNRGEFKAIFSVPEHWTVEYAHFAFNEVRDGTHDSPKQFEGEGYPLVTSKNLKSYGLDFQNTKNISAEDHFEISKRSKVETGDILFSMIGTIGNVSIIEDKTDFSIKNVGLFRKSQNLLTEKFSYYWLKSNTYQSWLSSRKRGGTQKFVSLGTLRESPILIAPLAEQKRIVEKLDEVLAQVDTIKARLDGIPDLLKRFRQSVLASAVSGKLTEEWRGVNKTTDPLITWVIPREIERDFKLPKEWRAVKLGDVSERVSVGHVGKTSEFYTDEENGIPFLRSQNVRPGRISMDGLCYITKDAYNSLKKSQLRAGDLLVVRVGANRGDACILPDIFEKVNCANIVFARPKKGLSSYLEIYFQSPFAQALLLGKSVGGAQGVINTKSVQATYLALPPQEEQKEIVRLVDQYFSFADTIEAQVKKAQARVDNLTQSILAKAFRGELVPQNDDDEPAEVLLERIAQARKEAEALAKAAKKAAKTKKTSK